MTGNTADKHETAPLAPTTVAEVLRDLEPMGDLSQYVIDDLTPDEEDEFFRILEDALPHGVGGRRRHDDRERLARSEAL